MLLVQMQLQLFYIGRTGTSKYITTKSIEHSTIGIIGMGEIGQKIAEAVSIFSPQEILYYNRSTKNTFAKKVDLNELVRDSDIIFLTLPLSAGVVF